MGRVIGESQKMDTPTFKMCAVFQPFKDTLFYKFPGLRKQKNAPFCGAFVDFSLEFLYVEYIGIGI